MSRGSDVCGECGAWKGDNLHAKIRRQSLDLARLREERFRLHALIAETLPSLDAKAAGHDESEACHCVRCRVSKTIADRSI